MSLENAFIEQLAQYIEINYKEYLPVTYENILYEKYAPFVDIPERKELTRDQSMDLQHLLDEAGDSFHEKLFELIDKSGMSDLDQFLPRYFSVLLKNDFHQYISEVIIEGHTDTTADYLYNLELSQQRALSVAKYCLDEKSSSVSKDQIEQLQKIMTANGRSFSNPVYNPDGTIDMDASRRVEFKFRLKDEEMVEEMAQILNKNDQAN